MKIKNHTKLPLENIIVSLVESKVHTGITLGARLDEWSIEFHQKVLGVVCKPTGLDYEMLIS